MPCTTSVFIEQISLSRQAPSIVPFPEGRDEYLVSRGPIGIKPISFPPRTPIVGPMTRGTAIWLLVSGVARLIRIDKHGSVRSVFVQRGELVGLTETLSSRPYSGVLEAVSPCVFQRMGIDDLLKWLKWKPEMGLVLLRRIAADLSEAESQSAKVLMCDHYHRRKVNQHLGLN